MLRYNKDGSGTKIAPSLSDSCHNQLHVIRPKRDRATSRYYLDKRKVQVITTLDYLYTYLDMSNTGRKKKLASFNCDQELWESFMRRCQEQGTTATATLTRFISHYLDAEADNLDEEK